MELGVGQALTSFLDENGVPGIVQQTAIICPESLMGPVDEAQRKSLMAADGMEKYDQAVDPWTAYEVLTVWRQRKPEKQSLRQNGKSWQRNGKPLKSRKKRKLFWHRSRRKKKRKLPDARRKRKRRLLKRRKKKRRNAGKHR